MTTRDEIEALIDRVAAGDRAAFADLYRHTSAKLFGTALRILKTQAETEEAVQEIYVKIWRNAERYRAGGTSPMTWLITIARNHAIDRLRARRATSAGLDEAEAVRETVAILKQADLAPLDVTGYGTETERRADGQEIDPEEQALMARALEENSVVVAQMTPFFAGEESAGDEGAAH